MWNRYPGKSKGLFTTLVLNTSAFENKPSPLTRHTALVRWSYKYKNILSSVSAKETMHNPTVSFFLFIFYPTVFLALPHILIVIGYKDANRYTYWVTCCITAPCTIRLTSDNRITTWNITHETTYYSWRAKRCGGVIWSAIIWPRIAAI